MGRKVEYKLELPKLIHESPQTLNETRTTYRQNYLDRDLPGKKSNYYYHFFFESYLLKVTDRIL
jgi:hypothetical protein